MTWTHILTRITLGPSLTGLRGTQVMGSIIYTLVSSPQDSTRIADSGWISNLHIFDLIHLSTSSPSCTKKINIFRYISQGVLMNKPDNSNGSRGQLTAGTNTCHLLQIQSPWTWIRETGQTYSFAVFRTYKEWVPVVLRVPSASTRFSSRRRHGYLLAERIHVRIPGQTGWILGSYLHDMFQSWHSSFVAMT
jgi:hypothetical protein